MSRTEAELEALKHEYQVERREATAARRELREKDGEWAKRRRRNLHNRIEELSNRIRRLARRLRRKRREANNVSDGGLRFIGGWEGGPYLNAYRDPVGIWTIGFGHTPASPGQHITVEQAYGLLRSDAAIAVRAVRDYISVTLTQCEFDALVSFTFNCGTGALATSTLRQKINVGDKGAFAEELPKWVNGGGHQLPGLVKRRAAEVAMAERCDYGGRP